MKLKNNVLICIISIILSCTTVLASSSLQVNEGIQKINANFNGNIIIQRNVIDAEQSYGVKVDNDNFNGKYSIILEKIKPSPINSNTPLQRQNEINLTTSQAISSNKEQLGNTITYNSIKQRKTLPDLSIINLTHNTNKYPFRVGESADLSFTLVNTGASVSNVQVGVYVDDIFVNTINYANIEADYNYNTSFKISGVSEGNHSIKLKADYNNTAVESNENNNTCSSYFEWRGIPDIISEIYTVPATKEVDAGKDVNYEFKIRNIGTGVAKGPFDIALVMENGIDSVKQVFEIDYLKPGDVASANFNANFGQGSIATAIIEADSTNKIEELNENNNIAKDEHIIKYCVHHCGSYISNWAHTIYAEGYNGNALSKTNPSIQVLSSASKVYEQRELNAVTKWNGISSNLVIPTPIYSDTATADIRITAEVLLPKGVLGKTDPTMDNFTWTKIALTTTPSTSSQERERTIVHEMGHALGLAHPHEDGDSCGYPGIMWQSSYISSGEATYEITNADKYNIKHLYQE